ncbi:hypothetical protein [Microvirga guangxiensis]|uniref:hypothetical protein n=1 Tax=Microvirga guangxiensis TaxID=549386 RepID=UPI000B856F1C|nr:hypothetical protein [Microvirga guangxiensis]
MGQKRGFNVTVIDPVPMAALDAAGAEKRCGDLSRPSRAKPWPERLLDRSVALDLADDRE